MAYIILHNTTAYCMKYFTAKPQLLKRQPLTQGLKCLQLRVNGFSLINFFSPFFVLLLILIGNFCYFLVGVNLSHKNA